MLDTLLEERCEVCRGFRFEADQYPLIGTSREVNDNSLLPELQTGALWSEFLSKLVF